MLSTLGAARCLARTADALSFQLSLYIRIKVLQIHGIGKGNMIFNFVKVLIVIARCDLQTSEPREHRSVLLLR